MVARQDTAWVASYRGWTLSYLAAVVLLVAMSGSTEPTLKALGAMALAFGVSFWCLLDAQLHGKVFHRAYALYMVFTYPIGLLLYLVWTRRRRGVVWYFVSRLAWAGLEFAGLRLGAALR